MTDAEGAHVATQTPRAWLYILVLVPLLAVMLVPALLVVTIPAHATVSGPAPGAVPPIPRPAPNAVASLSSLYDAAPAVNRAVTSSMGRAAIHDFDTSHLTDPTGAARMFHDAWASLVVPQDSATSSAINFLEAEIIHGQVSHDAMPSTANAPLTDAQNQIQTATRAIGSNSGNATALNNAAVALLMVDLGNSYGTPVTEIDGYTIESSCQTGTLGDSFRWLLAQGTILFPEDVDLLINDASYDFGSNAAQKLSAALGATPNDVSLRIALAEQQGGAAAHATLQPLLNDSRLAPLAYATLGDLISASDSTSGDTPFTSRGVQWTVLAAYDHALAGTTDPAVYDGRAQALDSLGYVSQAANTEREAVRRAPRSPAYLDRLAQFEAEAGDITAARRDARAAFSLDTAGWDLPLTQVRTLKTDVHNDGYAGRVKELDICGGGGGGALYLDAIPKYDVQTISEEQAGESPHQQALLSVLMADTLTGDAAAASSDGARWRQVFPHMQPSYATNSLAGASALVASHGAGASSSTAAAQLSLSYAEATLRYARQYAQAYQLCIRQGATQCAGESVYLTAAYQDRSDAARLQHYHDAARLLLSQIGKNPSGDRQQDNEADNQARFEGTQALVAAARLERQGGANSQASADADQARRILRDGADVSVMDGSDDEAEAKLGDVDLDTGQTSNAVNEYTDAISRATRSGPVSSPPTYLQTAYNNRGIGRLLLAQSKPDATPDCGAGGAVCEQALDDFRHALAGDPGNPIFLMNAGWAARLLDKSGTALAYLSQATTDDPTLFPALNDLGVLEAEEGNIAAARHDFSMALLANPKYDLAAWNLGVLDMHAGIRTAVDGQAFLAKAIHLNSRLRTSELSYKTDERFYRYLVGPGARGGAVLGRNLGVAAAALGWIAVVAAIYQAIRWFIIERAGHRVIEGWEERGPHTRWLWFRWLSGEEDDEEERPLGGMIADDEGNVMVRWGKPPRPWTKRIEPWLAVIPALVAVCVLISRRESPESVLASAALTVLATGIALTAHEAGHLAAALVARARMRWMYWRAGIPLALLLAFVPVDISAGPYLGHRVEEGISTTRAWWIAAGGSIANLLMAGFSFALYTVQPLPMLRLIALAQLAVCAYALLPLPVLDGSTLEKRPHGMFLLGLIVAVAGMAAATGIV